MKEKTFIDKRRESAITMEVGGDDASPISDFLSTTTALYVIKANSIHKIQMADDIDPGRTNLAIPNLSQQVMTAGSRNPIVATVLLTAKVLFDTKNAQLDEFSGNLFEKSLALTQKLIEIEDATLSLRSDIDRKQAEFATENMSPRAFRLPSVPALVARIHSILMGADKAKDAILEIFRLQFLPDRRDLRKLEPLDTAIKAAMQSDHHLIECWTGMAKYFSLIRNIRNASEHPKPNYRINVSDFAMQLDGSVTPPLIEVEHPDTPIRPLLITEFLDFVVESLLDHAEAALALIKSASLLSHNPFGEIVVALPPEERRNQHVRFYRAISLGGELRILG